MRETITPVLHGHMIVCVPLTFPEPKRKSRIGIHMTFCTYVRTTAQDGKPLSVANGAPLRLRVERQLGYEHSKYVMRVEVVENLHDIGGGEGGFWEDRGYEWYAGI